eukprot:gene18461-22029_t
MCDGLTNGGRFTDFRQEKQELANRTKEMEAIVEQRQLEIKIDRVKEEAEQSALGLTSEFKQEKLRVLAELEGERAAHRLLGEAHTAVSREAEEKAKALMMAEAEIGSLSTFLSASQEAADLLRIAIAKEEASNAARTKESLEAAARVE